MTEHYRTVYTKLPDDAKPLDKPKRGLVSREIAHGKAFRTADQAIYVVNDNGQLRRVGKKRGSKKQQRAERRAERQAKVVSTPAHDLIGEPTPMEPVTAKPQEVPE